MAKIHIGGAGGAPSNNFIRSLRESSRQDYLIGANCFPSDLFLADTDERYVVPCGDAPDYRERILDLLQRTRPDFLHVQNDVEVLAVSEIRDEIESLGTKLFMPAIKTVRDCVDKYRSYQIWAEAGLPVPRTRFLQNPADLDEAFADLGNEVWLRATFGAGGRGALPANDPEFARLWIERFGGWGHFTAAEMLTPQSITWLSIWHRGALVVAQTRKRHNWNFGNRTLSGVTGITGVAETCSYADVDDISQRAILAIDPEPHGIFGVDMTYDTDGRANPTEINIGRFFTTHYFFTKAGLNMPEIYCNIALDGVLPDLSRKINPLPDGLVWIRGMDVHPVLTTVEELGKMAQKRW